MRYSPDELKAIILFYGTYKRAAEKLGVGVGSLTAAATSDLQGRSYNLSDESTDRIYSHLRRLGDNSKREIRSYEKLLRSMSDHLAVKRAFMAGRTPEQQWALEQHKKYGRILKSRILWTKIMGKFYDKYRWRKGQFKR